MSNIDKQALRDSAESTINILENIAGFEPSDIDGDTVELRFETEDGFDTGCDVSIVDQCQKAADVVLALLDELEAKDKRIAELSASHGNLREAMAGIHNTITAGGAYTPLAAILNSSKRAYTAPPAPVAPDEMTPQQASRSYGGEVRGYRDGWNACRSAMLHGAEPVTTAYKLPEGWVAVPVEPTEEMIAAAMCSNDVLFDKEDDTLFRVQHGEIWRAMLSTAPQQEVKP